MGNSFHEGTFGRGDSYYDQAIEGSDPIPAESAYSGLIGDKGGYAA